MSEVGRIELLPCDRAGRPIGPVESMPQALVTVCEQGAAHYARTGYSPPWVSYVAVIAGRGVGAGAFVGAPQDGVVEIAYFTLPELVGRGYATQTATRLVQIARQALPGVELKALTLKEASGSTRILERLGFAVVGLAQDADAGEVWEWRLPAARSLKASPDASHRDP